MENKYNLNIVFTYSDGRVSLLPVESGAGVHRISDVLTDAELTGREINGVCEYTLLLKGICEKQLKYADVLVRSAAISDSAKIYNAGFTTNCAACISRYPDMHGQISAGPLLINGDFILGAALTSADRFFSYFKVMPGELIIRHSMEDKPLYQGNEYRLERFILGTPGSAEDFIEAYTDIAAARYNITREFLRGGFDPVPAGYCSWSCYYTLVDEEKLFRAERTLMEKYGRYSPSLVQIDDGWQIKHNFSGYWTADDKKFPGGLKKLADKCEKDGMRFGLWLAPLLAAECTGFWEEFPHWKKAAKSGTNPYLCAQEKVYTLKLDDPGVLEYLASVFRRAREEYGAGYFKLDFMVFALHSLFDREDFVIYDSDYSIAVYRRALQVIRDAVGPDAFLLACGAPLLAGAGIFNGIRISPDITWGKNKNHPTQWELIRMCSVSCAMRWFYHDKLFINDPDGLVVRDFDFNDNYDVTYNEARFWATAVALSGGSSLINEQIEKLGPARSALYSEILPPLGIAARPADFFEHPWPSRVFIPLKDGARLWGIYNYSDVIEDMELKLEGKQLIYNCWGHSVLGVRDSVTLKDMMPHSAEVLYSCPLPETAAAVFSDCNLFAGADLFAGQFEGDRLIIDISEKLMACPRRGIYVYLPVNVSIIQEAEECASGDWGRLVRIEARSAGRISLEII